MAILIIIIFLVVVCIYCNESSKKLNTSKELQNNYIQQQGIYITKQYKREGSYFLQRFIVDDVNKKVYYFPIGNSVITIPFREIIGCKIMINEENTYSMGRALAGGMVAGPIGAVIGATTTPKYINSYKIIVSTNNLSYPSISFSLLSTNNGFKENESGYIKLQKFGNNIIACIETIIYQNQNKK